MKRRILFVLFIFSISLSSVFAQDFSEIYSLYKSKDYFHFRDNVKRYSDETVKWHKPFLEAISCCIFGNFEKSNTDIAYILDNFKSEIPDSLLKDIYQKKYYNHSFLSEYKSAYYASNVVSDKYRTYLTKDENETLKDDIMMFKILKDTPAQKVTKSGNNVKLKTKKDMAGLWRVPINVENTDFEFVFDTGADYSVIVESIAKKIGMQISEEEFNVGTSTDKKVTSKIGIAKSVKIGDILLENVVFYVMKDEDFTFGPYKIEGIIGTPIMRGLEEIKLSQENEITIPAVPETSEIKNLSYEQYAPIIQMVYGLDSLNFLFDSGNSDILLFEPFLKKYEKEITSKYKLTKVGLGGAGGTVETDGYIIDVIALSSGTSAAEMKKVTLIAKPLMENQRFFHGNLGQAYIKQFKTLVLNYKNMYIDFQN